MVGLTLVDAGESIMVRTVWVCIVPRAADEEVIVVDASEGGIQSRWHAQRVINALRAKLPLEQITRDVVVLTDGTEGGQAFGSSPNAEAFIRRMMPQLSDYKWQSKELDW
ncbi:MAG: hypothetical protein EKK35_23500 [Bradyrhizobiaceae bacterium]|nr:MAG: hypothetical protein EKK35_23500 [Bradyrhizobiaceae bacterium]